MNKTLCVFTYLRHKPVKARRVLLFLIKNDPKWSQDDPKTAPRRAQDERGLRNRFWINFGPHFDPVLKPCLGHCWDQFLD